MLVCLGRLLTCSASKGAARVQFSHLPLMSDDKYHPTWTQYTLSLTFSTYRPVVYTNDRSFFPYKQHKPVVCFCDECGKQHLAYFKDPVPMMHRVTVCMKCF